MVLLAALYSESIAVKWLKRMRQRPSWHSRYINEKRKLHLAPRQQPTQKHAPIRIYKTNTTLKNERDQ